MPDGEIEDHEVNVELEVGTRAGYLTRLTFAGEANGYPVVDSRRPEDRLFLPRERWGV